MLLGLTVDGTVYFAFSVLFDTPWVLPELNSCSLALWTEFCVNGVLEKYWSAKFDSDTLCLE